MSYPTNELRVDPDRFRVSCYYDEHGRMTNLDVIVNTEISISELSGIIHDVSRATPGSARPRVSMGPGMVVPPPLPTWDEVRDRALTTTNGNDPS